jgi:hypothetical protein
MGTGPGGVSAWPFRIRSGSKGGETMSAIPPKSGHCRATAGCPLCANSGHALQQFCRYSPRLLPAATSPASATTAATARAASPTASASAEAASAAVTSTSAAPSNFFKSNKRCRGVFLVEDVERRQTDIGNFFFTEEEFVMRCCVLHRHIHRRPSS